MKKSFGYLVVAGRGGGRGGGAGGAAPASAATLANATRLVLDTGGGDPNGGVGEAGVGDAGGVSTTLTSDGTRWTVFESLSSDLVAGDTNGAVDVFVTNGTTVTRLSVASNGAEGGSGLNSYDPVICSTGRKVAYVTENEFDVSDANGAPDVYVIDRDADEDGVFDEFASANAVTVSVVSVSYDTDLEEIVMASNGASSPRFSSDCTKVAFVTDEYFNLDDLNFAPDVYMNTLGSVATPAVWVSTFASGGAEGGGYLPVISADGSKVAFVTDAVDVVSSSGTVGGLVISEVGASSVTSAAYASVKPNGTPSTSALIDTEYPPAISADGECIAFKANSGFDLLAGNSGPAEGVYLWDNRGASPVVSLVSKITTGQAATSASAPRISDDCRFVAYESNDDFISANDSNNRLDVYLYDTVLRTTQLISSNAAGNAADANSSLADLDYDATTGQGVVLVASGASNIRGASGGGADIDLFMVPFTASSSSFSSLSPTRVFDTRQNIGGVGTAKIGNGAAGGTPLEFTVLNKAGLPASASSIGAVSLNVTVVDGQVGDEGGFVTVYPCGTLPDVSNLNFTNGQTVPNAVITPVSAQGKVCFYVYGKAHLIADVNGYFAAGLGFNSVTPARQFDTRQNIGGVGTTKIGNGAAGGTALEFTVVGKNNVPATGVGAVSLNVTVVDGQVGDEGGFVTVYPCGTLPDVSNLNFTNGQTVPNAVITPVSAQGKVCFYVYGKAHLIADVNGYF
ncbi:MAG: TolB family protein, partial [Ilumatobacteraceae bacterium]